MQCVEVKTPIVNAGDNYDEQPPSYSADDVEVRTLLEFSSMYANFITMIFLSLTQLKAVLPSTRPCSHFCRNPPVMREAYTSIFTLVCCFWPFGIVAMLKALKVLLRAPMHEIAIPFSCQSHVDYMYVDLCHVNLIHQLNIIIQFSYPPRQ